MAMLEAAVGPLQTPLKERVKRQLDRFDPEGLGAKNAANGAPGLTTRNSFNETSEFSSS